jgi:ferredoxin-type protein NapG
LSRRGFFKLLGKSLAQAAAEFTYEATKPSASFVRPPGSCDEDRFLSLCQKCGECVKSCPTGVLDRVSQLHPLIFETPYMNFENNYCEKCYACIDACPNGALSRENIKRCSLVAVLKKDRCVAYQDVFCQSCYWSCPKMDRAIKLVDFSYPEFISSECTGCGRCINACPTNPKAIEMVIRFKSGEEDKR